MTHADNVTFDASVAKVTTMVDGSLRVTFDLPETAIDAAAWLMEVKRNEVTLRVACVMVGEVE